MLRPRLLAAECKKLEREYTHLHEYFSTFNQLKQSVAEHLVQAETDPQARERRDHFYRRFPQGFSGLDREINQDIKEISGSLKKLEAELKQLGSQMNGATTSHDDNQ